jgi:hypothetical protein
MNESAMIDNHRTIDTEKLSTICTLNFLRDSVIFKDNKNKYFEDICPEKTFEQMKISMNTKSNKASLPNESVLTERSGLFKRLREISKQLRLSNQTLHLVYYYIDIIIAKNGKFENVSFENVALGCLSLASKKFNCKCYSQIF